MQLGCYLPSAPDSFLKSSNREFETAASTTKTGYYNISRSINFFTFVGYDFTFPNEQDDIAELTVPSECIQAGKNGTLKKKRSCLKA